MKILAYSYIILLLMVIVLGVACPHQVGDAYTCESHDVDDANGVNITDEAATWDDIYPTDTTVTLLSYDDPDTTIAISGSELLDMDRDELIGIAALSELIVIGGWLFSEDPNKVEEYGLHLIKNLVPARFRKE